MRTRMPDVANQFFDAMAFPDGSIVQNALVAWDAGSDSAQTAFVRHRDPAFMLTDAQALKLGPLMIALARLFDRPIAYTPNGRSFNLDTVDHHPALVGTEWDKPCAAIDSDADAIILGGTFHGYYRYYVERPSDFLGPAIAQCFAAIFLGSKEQDGVAHDNVIRELITFAQHQDELDWFVMERVGPRMETDIARRCGLVCGATLGADFENDWYFDVRGGKQRDVYPASA